MIIGGGFKAIKYSLKASYSAGFKNIFKAVHSKNTCKTCALGMGGQRGGMTDEMKNFPEICKKSFQAQITDIQPAIPQNLFQQKSIEVFKESSPRLLERTGRLNNPLYKAEGDSHYSVISWDEALQKIVDRFKSTLPEKSFFYSSGRSSNEAAFLLQLFARVYGSNNINNSSYYCHQASGAGISSVIGTGTATIQLQDLEQTDLIFVIGANPASNHPRFIRQLYNCRIRGGHVVVVNPAKEKGLLRFAIPSNMRSMLAGGSKIATEYLQPNIGGDIALLKGIAKAVIEEGKHDLHFIGKYTNGSVEYISDIKSTAWETIESNSGISEKQICEIAHIYSNAKNVVFSWAVGITHHEYGVENVESIVNLALLRGMIGKRFSGLLPLRGHSNVQGIGSVGVVPALKEKTFKNIEKVLGIKIPTGSGKDTMSSMKACEAGEIDLAFMLGGNLYHSNPDTQFAEKALNKVPFKVYLNTTLNPGHFNGVDKEVVILPVAARDEEYQKTTQESMFNYVRMSDGGIFRLNNVMSEVDIISHIADKVMCNSSVNFEELKQHKNLRKLISQTVPGYEKLNDIDETCTEFQISGRTYHKPEFATPDKKANFRVCPIPFSNGSKGQFRMMTVRSEGQFNTVVYDEEDIYRGQTNRRIIMMNKVDIEQKGLKEDDLVTLKTATGKMKNVKVRQFDIKSGNVMAYYPEANILIPTIVDPRSCTPAFKSVWVTIEKQ